MAELTKQHYQNAYDIFFGYFPEDKVNADPHREEIIDTIMSGGPPSSTIRNIDFVRDRKTVGSVSVSKCEWARIMVGVDVCKVLLDLVGFDSSVNDRELGHFIEDQAGPTGLRGLDNDINTLIHADSAIEKAKAFFK